MFRNKKGFTLVELLAVIVILAIILAIAVPTISTLITNQKKSAYAAGVRMLIKGIDYQVLSCGATDVATLKGASCVNNATLTAAHFGGNTTDYGTLTVDSINTSSTSTQIDLAAAAAGQFKGCTVTNAEFTNIVTTGTTGADGVVSGC